MDEAEHLADRIAVLSAGRVVAQGTPRTLGGRDHMTTAISFTLPAGLAARDLPDGLRPLAEPGPAGSTVLSSESPLVHLQMLSNWALSAGFDLPGIDVHRTALALAVTVVVGAAAFCCLGYALSSLINNEDATQPATQAVLLPLYFISGVFVSITVLPHWLAGVGDVFPVRHLRDALLAAYNPHTTGLGFAGWDLLIVAAWGAVGLLVALRRFSWLPLGR
jgi:hypothetical protein